MAQSSSSPHCLPLRYGVAGLQEMTDLSGDYSEWRLRWPRVVVERDTEAAQGLLKRYYAVRKNGAPQYTGSRLEAIAALNPDPYVDTLAA